MTLQQQKYLKYSAGAAIVGLAVYFVFFKGKENGPGGYDPTGNGGNGTNPGGVVFNAKKTATDLWEILMQTGFAGAWINSDDAQSILEILTPINETQFGQVITAYGQLNYNTTLGNQSFMPWSTPTKHGLVAVLKNELPPNTEIYRTLKSKYPKYL